jgi:hypothetical protein
VPAPAPAGGAAARGFFWNLRQLSAIPTGQAADGRPALPRGNGVRYRGFLGGHAGGGLAALTATGLVTALGGAAFHLALRERGLSFRRAWFATVLVFLGTTLSPYATLLQGHAAAAAWLFLLFYYAPRFVHGELPVALVWLLLSPWTAARIGYLREGSGRTSAP